MKNEFAKLFNLSNGYQLVAMKSHRWEEDFENGEAVLDFHTFTGGLYCGLTVPFNSREDRDLEFDNLNQDAAEGIFEKHFKTAIPKSEGGSNG